MVITVPGNMLVLAAAGASVGGALVAVAQRKATSAIEAHKDALDRLHLYLVAKDAVQLGSNAATGVLGAIAGRPGVLDFSAAKAEAISQGVAAGAALATDVVSALAPRPQPGPVMVTAQVRTDDTATIAVQTAAEVPAPCTANTAAQPVVALAQNLALSPAPGNAPAAS